MRSGFRIPSRLRPVLAAAGVVLLCLGVHQRLDLEPRVDSSFFFAPSDPALRAQSRIDGRFGELAQVVILARSADISDAEYLPRVARLGDDVRSVAGVIAIHSLARGPDGLEDARQSPLWRRLLLAGDGRTSFVIIDLPSGRARPIVEELEAVVAEHEAPGFQLALAGVPYTVEIMRRQLVRDFAVFSGAAVVLFGIGVLVIFRSASILAGTMLASAGAVAATLLLMDALGFGIGLLSANLTTIIFVLALSHTVFLTTNWQTAEQPDARKRVRHAVRTTLPASLGSGVTTLLGFGSLLFVPAYPLRELGAGGALGATCALIAAYLVMPPFLERARGAHRRRGGRPRRALPRRVAAWAVVAVCSVCALGIARLDTDPSLLAYFAEDSGVRSALETLDRSGGSSPLSLVVQMRDRGRLDEEPARARLEGVHRALEADPAVGRVVSLPLLIAEAERIPGVSLLQTEWILDLIGPETTGAFLTEDRRQTLLLLQMSEADRQNDRTDIIARLVGVAAEHGFVVVLSGGVFALQARLADLVEQSMLWSLGALVLLFVAVATLAAGSLRVGLAAGAAIALIPVATLGAFGLLRAPLDVIAAPAASVGLGLAADATLHLVAAWRRRGASTEDRWRSACAEQATGILRATGIVALGFALFGLSSFPPTQRFGLGVAFGALLGAAVALWLVPELSAALGRLGFRKASQEPS